MSIKQNIEKIAGKIIAENSYELIDLKLTVGGKYGSARIVLDKIGGGITIQEIADITREIKINLDVEMDFSNSYNRKLFFSMRVSYV